MRYETKGLSAASLVGDLVKVKADLRAARESIGFLTDRERRILEALKPAIPLGSTVNIRAYCYTDTATNHHLEINHDEIGITAAFIPLMETHEIKFPDPPAPLEDTIDVELPDHDAVIDPSSEVVRGNPIPPDLSDLDEST
jgi:phage tail protein X